MIGVPLRQSTRCLNIAPTERLFMSENESEFLNPTEDEARITRRTSVDRSLLFGLSYHLMFKKSLCNALLWFLTKTK